MKLHSLRYFAVLAEELHFGRAAERLAITQPPLSSAIKGLEEELGIRLFVRDSKHVRLTPAGAAFLTDVQVILERVNRAQETARAVDSGLRGRLDVGVTGSLIYRETPRIIAAFAAAMPGIEVTLREVGTSEQVEALLHGELQAGFINAATVPPQLQAMALRSDRFVVCLPAEHPLANAKSLKLAEIAHERFVMFARDVAPANYDNVIAIFSRAGIHPRTAHAVRHWLTIVAMVANGLGVSLVPESLAQSGVMGVRFIPIEDKGALSPALLAWNPDHTSPALESFIRCASTLLPA
jgi:DNA-binding transcriptional LysR family regulator